MARLTLGDLYDRLNSIRDAEQEVVDAERALSFGGNEETMRGKQESLRRAIREVDRLRDQPLEEED